MTPRDSISGADPEAAADAMFETSEKGSRHSAATRNV